MSMSLQGAEMKTSLKCVLILITLITLAMCAASSTQTSTPPFALTLEAEENPVKAGSEVKVDITLQNSSNRAIHVHLSLAEMEYTFEVRDGQNRIPPETEYARKAKGRGYFSNDQIFYLQPGESLPKDLLVLTRFYDMSRPGKYTVQVSRAVPKELGGGTVKSNTLTITVVEPTPEPAK
jgi:hypothetical protein